MVEHPAFLLDQVSHTAGGPQIRLVAQRLGTAFQSLLDFAKIGRTEAWLAARTARLLQPGAPFLA